LQIITVFVKIIKLFNTAHQASDVAPSSVICFYYVILAVHHMLLCVVHICQQALNFMDAYHCYKQK